MSVVEKLIIFNLRAEAAKLPALTMFKTTYSIRLCGQKIPRKLAGWLVSSMSVNTWKPCYAVSWKGHHHLSVCKCSIKWPILSDAPSTSVSAVLGSPNKVSLLPSSLQRLYLNEKQRPYIRRPLLWRFDTFKVPLRASVAGLISAGWIVENLICYFAI